MSRSLFFVILIALAAPVFGAERPVQLQQMIDRALRESPALEAARERLRAVERRATIDRRLPDTRLSLALFAAPVETRVGPQRLRLGAMQPLPPRGTRALAVEVADHTTAAARRRLEALELELAYRLTRTYAERRYLVDAIELTVENIAILHRFEEIARTRYTVGDASHPDLVRIRVEIGKLENRLAELRQRDAPLVAELTALLGDAPGALAAPIGPLPAGRLALDREQLLERLERQPALLAFGSEIDGARSGAVLAERRGRPSWSFGLSWTAVDEARTPGVPGSGDDVVMAQVGLSLPLWRRADRERVAAERDRERAIAADRRALALELTAQVERALFEHRDAVRREELHRDVLIPQVTEWLRAAVIAFSTGESDFLDLLDTERTLIEFQLAWRRAEADRVISFAEIEALVGTRLPTEDPS